jgi:flavin-binding protein dodecin
VAGDTYKLIELVGTSELGVSEAIDAAVNRASRTLSGLEWFEVQQVRGSIENGHVREYQVDLRLAFRVMDEHELQA